MHDSIMTGLDGKSKENIEAAKLLQGNSCYTPSIHCAYYSAYQYLKSSLTLLFNTSYRKLKEECSQKKKVNESSHDFYISYIRTHRTDLKEDEELGNFIDDMKKLRDLRNIADYEEDDIKLEDSKYAINTSERLVLYLREDKKLWKKKKY